MTAGAKAKIRARLARGERYRAVAAFFGVTPSLISCIALGKIWKEAA